MGTRLLRVASSTDSYTVSGVGSGSGGGAGGRITVSVAIYLEQATSGSLKDFLRTFGPPKERILARYCRDVLRGLAFLNDNGVLHRDIKPSK